MRKKDKVDQDDFDALADMVAIIAETTGLGSTFTTEKARRDIDNFGEEFKQRLKARFTDILGIKKPN